MNFLLKERKPAGFIAASKRCIILSRLVNLKNTISLSEKSRELWAVDKKYATIIFIHEYEKDCNKLDNRMNWNFRKKRFSASIYKKTDNYWAICLHDR